MKGKDIMKGMNFIGSDLIENGEMGKFPESERQDPPAEPKPRRAVRIRRPVLVAAVIALMVFLVGCTAVVLLRLDKLRIAQEPYVSKTRYSEDGTKILPTEKLRGTYILAGENSKTRQALLAWEAFLQEFDPDGAKQRAAWDSGDTSEYDQALLTKEEEICKTYGLGRTGEAVIIQQQDADLFRQLMGVDTLLKPDGALEGELDGGHFYACGNFFACYPNMLLKDADSGEDLTFWMNYVYRDNGYFARDSRLTIQNEEAVQEWNHTLPGGETVLVVMDAEGDSYILYDRGDAFITVVVRNVGPNWDNPADVMTHRDMERIADSLIFTPKPEEISNFSQLKAELDEKYRVVTDETEPPEVVAERKRVYEENELQDSFAALIDRMETHEDYFLTYKSDSYKDLRDTADYALMDATGDGEEDLILGRDGKIFAIWSILDGKTTCVAMSREGTLCEGNVLWEEIYLDGAIYHWYYQLGQGDFMKPLQRVEYSVHEESWLEYDTDGNGYGEKISEERMQEIVDSYTPMELSWKSVREFPMN